MPQLLADCLNEILEYLNDDKRSLHSCLLVNRLWCQISVGILWRDCNNYSTSNYNTLINCLPDDSIKLLNENGIINSTPSLRYPTFNYAIFCRVLSISEVHEKIKYLLIHQYNILQKKLINYTQIVVQEICKMFMNQTSLKILEYVQYSDVAYNIYPSPRGFLKNLSELTCSSNISSELLRNLAQTCQNLFLLDVVIIYHVQEELVDLITNQKNLKCFGMMIHDGPKGDDNSIPSLMINLPKTLTKFIIVGGNYIIPLSFLVNFTNLEELEISFDFSECIESFEKLQDANFPQLQSLTIKYACPRMELLIKFLENNGKNLTKIYIDVDNCEYSEDIDDSISNLNLTIAKYCPNIRKLSTGFGDKELETLKVLFNNCQYLESIKIWCGGRFLSEKEALETVLEYSKNVYEIILHYQFDLQYELLPDELESFFTNWINRISRKPISFVVIDSEFCINRLDKNNENMKIIEKYIKLGIVKNFEIGEYS